MEIKTRFAPSPTGYFHIGGARTALYSWLFARHHNGKFVLRIEDSDLQRVSPKSITEIIDAMNWLKLEWDEGPYFQSNRFYRYNEVINEMLAARTAYKCYCSRARLDSLRQKQISEGKKPRYDGHCRNNYQRCSTNQPFVVRFANPKNGLVVFNDKVYGQIKFSNQELDDLIIRRSDGSPTYNLCVVVDDWDMKITHVIRGEDHINNTPRQINILKALNAPVPIYAHVSMINGNDGKKLSKRHGSVSVMEYRDDGYLPEALLNYLVRLGWSNQDQEIFSQKEMIECFSLDSVRKSSCIFDTKKLLWLNQYYINSMKPEYVAIHLKRQIEKAKINLKTGPSLVDLVKMFSKRCKTLKEIPHNARYFYEEFNEFDPDAAKKYLSPVTYKSLELVRNKLISIKEWTLENIHHAIQGVVNELQVLMSKVGMPLRVALTGSTHSPELEMSVYAIGKSRSISRINKALSYIKASEANSTF